MTESISQRQLVFELKHAVDVCMRRPWDRRAAQHLANLVDNNWHNAHSTHVQHNIGKERRHYLFEWDTRQVTAQVRALPSRRDPRSLGLV